MFFSSFRFQVGSVVGSGSGFFFSAEPDPDPWEKKSGSSSLEKYLYIVVSDPRGKHEPNLLNLRLFPIYIPSNYFVLTNY